MHSRGKLNFRLRRSFWWYTLYSYFFFFSLRASPVVVDRWHSFLFIKNYNWASGCGVTACFRWRWDDPLALRPHVRHVLSSSAFANWKPNVTCVSIWYRFFFLLVAGVHLIRLAVAFSVICAGHRVPFYSLSHMAASFSSHMVLFFSIPWFTNDTSVP
jgi:hypothetical protein